MRTFPLDSTWELSFTHPETGTAHTIPATVPGSAATDLMRAMILPDVYTGPHALAARRWERTDFTYSATFTAPKLHPGERLELLFEGVDTAAAILVNGKPVATLANMFIPHAVDITAGLVKKGPNSLTVIIRNAMDHAAERARAWGIAAFQFSHMASTFEAMYVRKAQHMFGWDIAPRLLFGGLWRPVALRVRAAAEILPDQFYFAVHAVDRDQRRAEINLTYGLAFAPDADWNAYELRIEGHCGDSTFHRQFPVHFTHANTRFTIENAHLWWPAGYGPADLYDVSLTLLYQGTPVDEYQTRVGLRTVALDLHTDAANPVNHRFAFSVNGVPVCVRGSNWVPADALHACDAERIPAILKLFTDSHCNIVRCWGGNVYEDHPFFEYCDEHGLLVWQDFMFGCARYPVHPEFLAQVRQEAEGIIRRLRNHPSLLLWAGDNEIDATFSWNNPGNTPPSMNPVSRGVLKEAVAFHDPFRPYLPSSPFIPDDLHFAGQEHGTPEQHLWGPRGYYKADFYAKNTAVFASEIGYHGMPARTSLERFLSPGKVWGHFNNDEWILHAAEFTGRENGPMGKRNFLMLNQVKQLFGESVDAGNCDAFILASQITQAEAKKYFIEMFRSGKPRRTGIIWWNMIDGWPQFSDAVVDYYFEKKLAWDWIRRAQQPVCLMFREPVNGILELVAVNDTLEAAEGSFRVRRVDAADPVAAGTFTVAANGIAAVARLPDDGRPALFIIEWESAGGKAWNHYCPGPAPLDFPTFRQWLAVLPTV